MAASLLLLGSVSVLLPPLASGIGAARAATAGGQDPIGGEHGKGTEPVPANGLAAAADAAHATVSRSSPTVPGRSGSEARLSGFFLVGMIINVAMMVAFLAWAVKQWKKT
jgi:hypothetical protein